MTELWTTICNLASAPSNIVCTSSLASGWAIIHWYREEPLQTSHFWGWNVISRAWIHVYLLAHHLVYQGHRRCCCPATCFISADSFWCIFCWPVFAPKWPEKGAEACSHLVNHNSFNKLMAPDQYCKQRRREDRYTYMNDCLRCLVQSSKHIPESFPSVANRWLRWQQTNRSGFFAAAPESS